METRTIENETWEMTNRLQFNFDADEETGPCNMYINIRNTTDYGNSNVFLFVQVLYPDNTVGVDTVEGIITDNKGRWLGDGSGRFRNNKFLYKRGITFPQTGKYVVTIEQAMRDSSLVGISAVGIEIEQLNK